MEYNINMNGVTYALLLVLVDEEDTLNSECVALGGQIIITNLVDPQELYNRIESSRLKVEAKYGVHNVVGEIIVKLRIISYEDNVYKNVLNIPKGDAVYNKKSLDVLGFNDHSMPLTKDLNQYGEVINKDFLVNGVKLRGVHYQFKSDIVIFVHDTVKLGERTLTVFKNNAIYDVCLDIINNKDILIRKYKNGFIIYIDNQTNKILYTESVIECKPLRKGVIDLIKDNKISSFDIECYEGENRIFKPYACAFTTPKNDCKLYYLTDFNSARDMLKQCIVDMLSSNLGTVYVHNLSKFDIFFVNNILKQDKDIQSDYKLNRDGKILSVTVRFKDKKLKGKFIFRDSLLLIQGSLSDITKKFKTEHGKLNFPYSFVKADNLNYVGDKPDYKFYNNMDEKDYHDIPCKN